MSYGAVQVFVLHDGDVQGDAREDGPADDGQGEVGASPDRTWFDVARAVGDDHVPHRADWVVLHVRSRVVQLMRDGASLSLAEAGIDQPQMGEALSLVMLRHHDGDHEVALHRVVQALHPRVGDPYGSGRVTETGVSRLASVVDPAHLRAIATTADNLRMLQALNLGAAVIAPVIAAGLVIGALNLVHSPGSAVPRDDLTVAESLGQLIGAALDASRPATATARPRAPRAQRSIRWTPPSEGNPIAAARAWIRRTLPELVDRPVRVGLGDDLDLVVSELAGNAVRHTGALGDLTVGLRDNLVQVAVFDRADRPPTLRRPRTQTESGRGLLLVAALSERWSVDHDLEHGGKSVWAEVRI